MGFLYPLMGLRKQIRDFKKRVVFGLGRDTPTKKSVGEGEITCVIRRTTQKT